MKQIKILMSIQPHTKCHKPKQRSTHLSLQRYKWWCLFDCLVGFNARRLFWNGWHYLWRRRWMAHVILFDGRKSVESRIGWYSFGPSLTSFGHGWFHFPAHEVSGTCLEWDMPIEWHYVEKRICFPYCRDCNTEAENLRHGFLEGGCWGLLVLLKICGRAMSGDVDGSARYGKYYQDGWTSASHI